MRGAPVAVRAPRRRDVAERVARGRAAAHRAEQREGVLEVGAQPAAAAAGDDDRRDLHRPEQRPRVVVDDGQALQRVLEQLARERVLAAAAREHALRVADRDADRVVADRRGELEPLLEVLLRLRQVHAAHRHDAEPLVPARDPVAVAEPAQDLERLLAERGHLQHAARAQVDRPGAHEHARAGVRRLRRGDERLLEPAAALDEVAAGHPVPEQRAGEPQRRRRVAPHGRRQRGAQVVVLVLERAPPATRSPRTDRGRDRRSRRARGTRRGARPRAGSPRPPARGARARPGARSRAAGSGCRAGPARPAPAICRRAARARPAHPGRRR